MIRDFSIFTTVFTSSRSSIHGEQFSFLSGQISLVNGVNCLNSKPVGGSQINYYNILDSIQKSCSILSTLLLSLKNYCRISSKMCCMKKEGKRSMPHNFIWKPGNYPESCCNLSYSNYLCEHN